MVKPIVPHATDNIFGAARAIARAIRLLGRRSQREERLRSLLLSTAARDPALNCSLRSRLTACSRYLDRFGGCLAAPVTRPAPRQPININEVDTDVLVARQCTDHRA